MSLPDGPEQRTAAFDESYERDLDALDVEAMLADEVLDVIDVAAARMWEGA